MRVQRRKVGCPATVIAAWNKPIFLNGEGEIRTPATLSGRPVFETGAFNHSATSPGEPPKLSVGFGGVK